MGKQVRELITNNILIVCALERELRIAKTYYKNHKPENIQADFLCTGIWNIHTTLTLTQKLTEKKYDFLINYWVCGYKDTKQDIIQVLRSVYAPTGKEILSPLFFEFAPPISIYCSETPVYDATLIWEENYVDMESFAIEKVCEHFRVPRIILKVPCDKVGGETHNFDISYAQEVLSKNIDFEKLFMQVSQYLESLPRNEKNEIFEQSHHFTQSERILLEKYIVKYETLSRDNFKNFYNIHRSKNKKDFFRELSNTLDSLSSLW